MKRKKQTLKTGQIAIDARVLELVLTAADTALMSVENMGGYIIQILDAALSVGGANDEENRSLRATVAEAIQGHRAMRQSIDENTVIIRATIAASRSTLTQAAERVM